MVGTPQQESLAAFRSRATTWVDLHLPLFDEPDPDSRTLQRLLFDHGFAGIPFPVQYGGAGLTLEHQQAFFDVTTDLGRRVPLGFAISIGMIGPTILQHGSAGAQLRFLPPLLRGDEVWIQLLSEPRGGSDLAGAITRLERDGDTYVLNGAKMWSTGAHEADYGLCLCRSDWHAPKHRGLSMVAVPLKDTEGLTVSRIRAASGVLGDFCQEFFDSVVLPAENLIGGEHDGWAVAQTLLLHERNAAGSIGYGYGYLGSPVMQARVQANGFTVSAAGMASIAAERGIDLNVATSVADAYIESTVGRLMSARLASGLRVGTHKGQWGSLAKLQSSVAKHQQLRTALAVFGADGVVYDGGDVRTDNPGTEWLGSRGGTLAGGSNEMQRNIISERLLGLPREPSFDRDLPFDQVVYGQRSQKDGYERPRSG